ncbi:MAG: CBASS cGAMP-activated phospholipase [Planctomycetota bacterium]
MAEVPFQILAFDGGGIRGAFGIGLVAELERRLGRPLAGHFDLVAGTSTGAITAAGLAAGMPGEELVRFYKRFGRQIFTPREPHEPKGWVRWLYPMVKRLLSKRTGQDFDDFFRAKYCPIALEDAFDNGFGGTTLAQLKAARLIVPTVNLSEGKSRLFRSPHLPGLESDGAVRVVDVLLAATAAPTYFPHKVMPDGQSYADGGLWAVNPSVLAIAEAMKIKQQCQRATCDPDYNTADIRVLSIGTGDVRYSLTPPGVDAGIIYWAQHVADVMTNLQVEGVQSPLSFLLGERYHPVNFELPDQSWSLDNTDKIDELFRLGRERAAAEFDRLAPRFFANEKPAFVPYAAATTTPANEESPA